MKDKLLEELNKEHLHKQFKYYGINGLCDWIGTIEEVGYVTQYSKDKNPTITKWIKSNNLIYYLNEILILETNESI